MNVAIQSHPLLQARHSDPAVFGRVAVLMGGWSAEREVSLWSGRGVLEALRSRGVDAHGVDCTPELALRLGSQGYDRAFNVMHGTGGEDGTLQAVLALQGIPVTGSGVLACALAMDKLRSKRIWKAEGLPTPDYRWIATLDEARAAALELGYPFVIKPSEEGSSVGVTIVREPGQIEAAVASARGEHGRVVMAERYVAGGEYTCSVVAGHALPVIKIVPDGEFYDYDAKYLSDKTRYLCPADLDEAVEQQIRGLSLQAFALIGASGWGRVDFLMDGQGRPWLLEANLVPGMTSHSLVPMAARAVGLDYAALCWAILETTLEDDNAC